MRHFKSAFLLALTTGSMMTLNLPAFADGITVTILNPSQTIAPGQTVTFNATLTAIAGNSKNYYLNSDTVNITDKGSVLTIDDDDFFNNFPIFLTPTGMGDTFTAAAFTVTNTGQVTEAYTGIFAVIGGANATATKKTTATFASPAVAVTPEPSSLVLLGTGLLGAFGAARRKFTKS